MPEENRAIGGQPIEVASVEADIPSTTPLNLAEAKDYAIKKVNDGRIIYPKRVLAEFKEIIGRYPQLLGIDFYNNYLGGNEMLPTKVEKLSILDLWAILKIDGLRKKVQRVAGKDTIGSLEILLKQTALTCLVTVKGSNQKLLAIDTFGFQWQGDIYQSGYLAFFPDEGYKKLPSNYLEWQKKNYKSLTGQDRSDAPSENVLKGSVGGIKGKFDLDLIQKLMKHEFLQCLFVANQAAIAFNQEKLDYRHIAMGMDIFASNLTNNELGKKALLYDSRLKGILEAFTELSTIGEEERRHYLSRIHFINLPYSTPSYTGNRGAEFEAVSDAIKQLGVALGVGVSLDGVRDAIKDKPHDDGVLPACTAAANPRYVPGDPRAGGFYGQLTRETNIGDFNPLRFLRKAIAKLRNGVMMANFEYLRTHAVAQDEPSPVKSLKRSIGCGIAVSSLCLCAAAALQVYPTMDTFKLKNPISIVCASICIFSAAITCILAMENLQREVEANPEKLAGVKIETHGKIRR